MDAVVFENATQCKSFCAGLLSEIEGEEKNVRSFFFASILNHKCVVGTRSSIIFKMCFKQVFSETAIISRSTDMCIELFPFSYADFHKNESQPTQSSSCFPQSPYGTQIKTSQDQQATQQHHLLKKKPARLTSSHKQLTDVTASFAKIPFMFDQPLPE